MNKVFAAALVCTATFATKVNQIEAEVEGFDIWDEDWSEICEMAEWPTNPFQDWFNEAD